MAAMAERHQTCESRTLACHELHVAHPSQISGFAFSGDISNVCMPKETAPEKKET